MASQEREAVGLFFQKHLAQIAVAKAHFTLVGNGTGDTEGLKALADGSGRVGSFAAVFLDSDGGAYGVSPLCVFKTNRLNAFHHLIYI